MDTTCESLWKKIIGKPYSGKLNVRFDEGELEIGYGCDTVTLTDERMRNGEYKPQPVATTPALYSTLFSPLNHKVVAVPYLLGIEEFLLRSDIKRVCKCVAYVRQLQHGKISNHSCQN